ncbi:MAG: hypothetical protein COU51_01890 [Parcubacteria group bacterium CG10_big_fil_rev_8_21_14_0_10_36_14]|nr:MAG: hypothetical protein COU51_01890 [Parcubacteria group bacterium CG10_big_fil_rev_8_21_14_0_10_36_14]
MRKLALFLSIFLFSCVKGTPATPLKVHNELKSQLEKEVNTLKKDFQTLKNETNGDIAKLQFQIISDRKRADNLIFGAIRGTQLGMRKLFGTFAASISVAFRLFDTRIKELEKIHHKKTKKK